MKKSFLELSGKPNEAPESKLVEIRHVTVTLLWKGLSPSEILSDMKYKEQKLTANSWFPVPWPSNIVSLTDYGLTIAALAAAILKRATNVRGSASELNAALKKAGNDTKNIMAMVQITVNNNPGQGVEIAESAGFTHKAMTPRGKRKNSAKPTTEPGVMIVTVEGKGPHQFQMSVDAGLTIIELPPSRSGETIVDDLISHKLYYFRGRMVLAGGAFGEWTNWFFGYAP